MHTFCSGFSHGLNSQVSDRYCSCLNNFRMWLLVRYTWRNGSSSHLCEPKHRATSKLFKIYNAVPFIRAAVSRVPRRFNSAASFASAAGLLYLVPTWATVQPLSQKQQCIVSTQEYESVSVMLQELSRARGHFWPIAAVSSMMQLQASFSR